MFGTGVRRRAAQLSYRQLEGCRPAARPPSSSAPAAGRGLFASQQGTPVEGTPWKLGGIGAARWRGVALGEVLEPRRPTRRAVDVMARGLDDPYVCDGVDHGPVRRPLPVGKALDDVLIALEMNGAELLPDHGFPARLVVPGWVGVASIKWLGDLEVATTAQRSPWNTRWLPRAPSLQPVKSAFELGWEGCCRAAGARAHRALVVRSRADPPRRGQHRRRRPLASRSSSGAERATAGSAGSSPWTPPPGRHELLARATDHRGLTQPDSVAFNAPGYGFWAVVRHRDGPLTARQGFGNPAGDD